MDRSLFSPTRRRALGRVLALPALTALTAVPTLSACGGDDDVFDPLQPREAQVADLAQRNFTFTGFQYGVVFDASLDKTPTTLSLGAATGLGSRRFELPFSLAAQGKVSQGTALFDEAAHTLDLTFSRVDAPMPFTVGGVLHLQVRADVDDGRISLTNLATGAEQTSAPE